VGRHELRPARTARQGRRHGAGRAGDLGTGRGVEAGPGPRGEAPGAGVALVGILGHRSGHDVVQHDGDPGARRPRWCRVDVGVHLGGPAFTGERPVPDEQLEEHAPQRIHVDPMVAVTGQEALRGHVVRGADGRAGAGQAGPRRRPRHTEVDDVGEVRPVLGGEQHVGGLHVPVHQARGVRGVERGSDLRDQVRRACGIERSFPLEHHGQVGSLDQPHVQEQPSVDLPEVMDWDHMWLSELRRQPGFPLESGAELGVQGQGRRQSFERHEALTPGVEGAVDLSHAASADQPVDPVGAKVLPGHARHRHPRPPRVVVARHRSCQVCHRGLRPLRHCTRFDASRDSHAALPLSRAFDSPNKSPRNVRGPGPRSLPRGGFRRMRR